MKIEKTLLPVFLFLCVLNASAMNMEQHERERSHNNNWSETIEETGFLDGEYFSQQKYIQSLEDTAKAEIDKLKPVSLNCSINSHQDKPIYKALSYFFDYQSIDGYVMPNTYYNKWPTSEFSLECRYSDDKTLKAIIKNNSDNNSNNIVQVMQIADGENAALIQTLTSEKPITAFSFSLDKVWAIGGTSDGIIKVWHLDTGHCFYQLRAHHEKITSISVGETNEFLISFTNSLIVTARIKPILDLYKKLLHLTEEQKRMLISLYETKHAPSLDNTEQWEIMLKFPTGLQMLISEAFKANR